LSKGFGIGSTAAYFFALPLPRPHNPFAARSVLIKKTRAQNDEHYARYKDANCFSNEWRVCGGIKPLKDITIEKRNADYAKKAGIKKTEFTISDTLTLLI